MNQFGLCILLLIILLASSSSSATSADTMPDAYHDKVQVPTKCKLFGRKAFDMEEEYYGAILNGEEDHVVVESNGIGRTCMSRSKRFEGLCFRRNNCAEICFNEGFSGGVCRFCRCWCTKPC
ncbi:hypothetical protein Dimus_012357 [Dionaea muscipula]